MSSEALDELVDVFSRWLYLPDPGALLAVIGTIAANRLDGDPVWLLLVGPPGSGKSEVLGAATSLPEVHPCATLTEAALLSGTPKREQAIDAKGGLLRNIGDYGIISAKDFGSVLSMNRDARALVLAALREVYDGSWTRHVGTDGGRTLHWSGKVGLLGGVTPVIDRHHAVMGAMGERFVLYRLPPVDARTQARRAFDHAGRETQMRAELTQVVSHLFEQDFAWPRAANENEIEQLVTLSTLVVRARSAVERDGYSRDIELIPGSEAPTRLIVVLAQLLNGLDAIGVERDTAWAVVTKAALDSVPALRLLVMQELLRAGLPVETPTVGIGLDYPTTTVKRTLEDLTAHGLVERERQGQGKADRWSLSNFAHAGLIVANKLSRKVVEYAGREDKEALEPHSVGSTATDISGEAAAGPPVQVPGNGSGTPASAPLVASLERPPVTSDPYQAVCPLGHFQRKPLSKVVAAGEPGQAWIRWALSRDWPLDREFGHALRVVAVSEGLASGPNGEGSEDPT